MQLNLKSVNDHSRYARVLHSPSPPRVLEPRVPRNFTACINKARAEAEVDCRVGDKSIDVDYMDINLDRTPGKFQKFLGSPYLNLSNPFLRRHAKVSSFFFLFWSLFYCIVIKLKFL